MMFKCNIIQENVSETNIKIWEKKIKSITLNNLQRKVLRRYEFTTIDEYIEYIKTNINNEEIIEELTRKYLKNKDKDLEEERERERERIERILKESEKRSDENVKIRMLTEKDEKKAVELYIKFKIMMEEDIENALLFVQDFILKNIIFGIFEKKVLAGIIIIEYGRKLLIDNYEEPVKTFYIQEMIVDEKYKGKGYGDILIKYAILRCPKDIDYLSFMTMPENIAMRKIGERNNFNLQMKPSGDKKHSLLFIRVNDRIERSLYKSLSYKKSTSSS